MSQLFTSGGQNIGVSASTSVLPMPKGSQSSCEVWREDQGLLSRSGRKRRPPSLLDSRSFLGGGRRPSCPSPSAGDLRELPRVPLRGEGSCRGGGAPRDSAGSGATKEGLTRGEAGSPGFYSVSDSDHRVPAARVTAGPKRPHLGVCPGPNFPLQGRQGSRGCIPGSPGESGLVTRGSQGLRSPLESRRGSLGAPERPQAGTGSPALGLCSP